MKYQETGRFGRITKHLRKQGFEKEMESILFDSHSFSKLKKEEQTQYVEKVVTRMTEIIGQKRQKKFCLNVGLIGVGRYGIRQSCV